MQCNSRSVLVHQCGFKKGQLIMCVMVNSLSTCAPDASSDLVKVQKTVGCSELGNRKSLTCAPFHEVFCVFSKTFKWSFMYLKDRTWIDIPSSW